MAGAVLAQAKLRVSSSSVFGLVTERGTPSEILEVILLSREFLRLSFVGNSTAME